MGVRQCFNSDCFALFDPSLYVSLPQSSFSSNLRRMPTLLRSPWPGIQTPNPTFQDMEPHGQTRGTTPNTPSGRTSRTRGPIHPRVNPWSSWCRDRIYYGLLSDQYSYNVDVGNQTNYTLSNLKEGKTYYFAAKAYDREVE